MSWLYMLIVGIVVYAIFGWPGVLIWLGIGVVLGMIAGPRHY